MHQFYTDLVWIYKFLDYLFMYIFAYIFWITQQIFIPFDRFITYIFKKVYPEEEISVLFNFGNNSKNDMKKC